MLYLAFMLICVNFIINYMGLSIYKAAFLTNWKSNSVF